MRSYLVAVPGGLCFAYIRGPFPEELFSGDVYALNCEYSKLTDAQLRVRLEYQAKKRGGRLSFRRTLAGDRVFRVQVLP